MNEVGQPCQAKILCALKEFPMRGANGSGNPA